MPVFRMATSIGDLDAISASGVTSSTTTSVMDSAAVNEAISVSEVGDAELWWPTPKEDFWLGMYYSAGGGTLTSANGIMFGFFDKTISTSFEIIGVHVNSTGTRISYFDGTTRQFSGYFPTNFHNMAFSRIDMRVKIANSDGFVEVYRDAQLIFRWDGQAGDTKFTASAGVTSLKLDKLAQSSASSVYSGIILADERTLRMRLAAISPSAAGSKTEWTGTWADIDETGVNDADFITASAADQTSLFNFTDLPALFSSFKVLSVGLGARGIGDAVSPQNIRGVVRTGGVEYDIAPQNPMPAVVAGMSYIWEQNPNTLAQWTAAQINAAEFGFKSAA